MATAEQNALLAMQLFQPNNQRLNDLTDTRLAQVQRLKEMAIQQNFARQQQDKLFEQQRTLSSDVADRQIKQQEAIERRQLLAQRAASYPVYAQAAAAIGEKARPITDYAESWDGLGQLQADMATLKEKAQSRKEEAGAMGVVAILDQATGQLKDAIEARNKVTEITDSDKAMARNMGIKSLQNAVENGEIPGVDIKSKKWTTILSALDKDHADLGVAEKLLGQQGMRAYTSGIQQGVLALQNDKDRLARIQTASREVVAAQRAASDVQNRLLQLAATNPALGPVLRTRSASLSALTSAPSEAAPVDTSSVFQRLIGMPAPAASPTPTPPVAASQSPSVGGIMGLAGRVPGVLSTIPGALNRIGSSLAGGITTGDFTPVSAQEQSRYIANPFGVPSLAQPPSPSPITLAPEPSPITLAPEQSPIISAPIYQNSQMTELERLRELIQQRLNGGGQTSIVPNTPQAASRANPNFLQDASLLGQSPIY